MSLLKALGLGGGAKTADQAEFVERRSEERRPVFQEAVVMFDDERFKLRVVITNLSTRGAGIAFANRMELPFRVRISATTMKLNRWARVAWQNDGAAGLEFLPGDDA